jgi:transcriptional regulator with XRE-family HTH domain
MAEEGRSILGEALKWLRESRRPRLTQEQLAELTGVPKGSISSVEAGVSRNPRPHVIDPLLSFFEMPSQADAVAAYRRHVLGEAGDVLEQARRIAEEAGGQAAREELARVGGVPARPIAGPDVVKIPHAAVVSAGPGAGYRQHGDLELPRSWLKGRDPSGVFAVTARGDCMAPAIPDGALLLCERVYRLEDVPSGTLCIVWVDEGDEDIGGNVKYVEWFTTKARLKADDGSVKVVDRQNLHIVGKVWRSFTDW